MRKCTLCHNWADPRMGVYDKDGNPYALCDGCSPASTAEDVQRVVALCVATGQPSEGGYPRFWPKEPT